MEKIKELIDNLELEFTREKSDKFRIETLCILINEELEKIKS